MFCGPYKDQMLHSTLGLKRKNLCLEYIWRAVNYLMFLSSECDRVFLIANSDAYCRISKAQRTDILLCYQES